MKTSNNLDFIIQNLGIKVKLKEIYDEALYPKSFSKRRFEKIFSQYIKGALKNYSYTANILFEQRKNKDFFYNAIKNKNYDFCKVLKDCSYKVLNEYLDKHKEHKQYDSWVSKNYITLVIDKMECERTTGNFEKSKKLYKADNGHYLINLCFVIGDDKVIYPIETVLYDNECGKSSIDIAERMLKDCVRVIVDSGIPLNRIRFSADREFLNHKILDIFKEYGIKDIKCVLAGKLNTVIYNKYDIKSNVRELKSKLYKEKLDDFKYSVQLDNWCSKHNRPRYKYYTFIRKSNFGSVRIVAFYDDSIELTDTNYNDNLHILLNPGANMTGIQMIVTCRGHRWHIEVYHKDLKQNIEIVSSYRGLSFIGLRNHYILRILSYLVLVRSLSLKGSWKRTIGKTKRSIVMLM